jgi:hypothetical protein
VPALDLVDRGKSPAVSIAPQRGADGRTSPRSGVVVTMHVKDLSAAALQQAMLSSTAKTVGSLVYAFRFVDGYQSAAAVARYDAGQGWKFGYSGYATSNAGCISKDDKCLIYPGDESTGDVPNVTGKVDVSSGTITMTVPLQLLKALGKPDASGQRPTEVPAKQGSRLYDATVFTFRNPSAASNVQGYMEHIDNAPSFDFLVGAGK